MRFSIETLGCKVNQYESQQVRQFLEGLGLKPARPGQQCDLVVVNTCCVTHTASAKSRQCIHRVGRGNPDAVTVVWGCLPAMPGDELKQPAGNHIRFVKDRNNLIATLNEIVNSYPFRQTTACPRSKDPTQQNSVIRAEAHDSIKANLAILTSSPKLPPLSSFKGHTRAFLKVQDGCDGLCTYCIVPKVRPDVHSKPIEDAIEEAKALVAAGHKEIVVTGVCLGAYGKSSVRKSTISDFGPQGPSRGDGFGIAELLDRLAQVPDLMRIRLSSLEPGDVTAELLDVFCAHSNIMPHIHLSVQSGSDRILTRMARQYNAAQLRERIELIKRRLDRPAITADFIVGFPGETDDDFEKTVDLANWAGFSKMHVFAFSLREGTPAAKLDGRLPPAVVKKRAEQLRKLSDELGYKFRSQFIGQTCEVLLEDTQPPSGRCERYFMVYLATKPQSHKETQRENLASSRLSGKNEIVKVQITAATGEGAVGQVHKS